MFVVVKYTEMSDYEVQMHNKLVCEIGRLKVSYQAKIKELEEEVRVLRSEASSLCKAAEDLISNADREIRDLWTVEESYINSLEDAREALASTLKDYEEESN